MADLLEQLETLRATEPRVVMATLVAARGGSPRPLGAKLFVGEGGGGRLLGSVSIGGCVDARVVEQADRLLAEGRARELVTVVVDDAEALELGLACGAEFDLLLERIALSEPDPVVEVYAQAWRRASTGQTTFVVTNLTGEFERRVVSDAGAPGRGQFIERFAPPDTLVIVGASDVAAVLARLARMMGLRVVVVDSRERYATADRFPGADLLIGMPAEMARPYLAEGASVVLVSHDYRHELPVLREALRAPVRYVGMLAGRKRADAVRALLRDEGLSEEEIARLQAPIGLDIGGREPEEIALSIAAQLVAVREGRPIARRDQHSRVPAPA